MSESPISTKVMPRRGAAMRASAAIAQDAQDDSDNHSGQSSGDEAGGSGREMGSFGVKRKKSALGSRLGSIGKAKVRKEMDIQDMETESTAEGTGKRRQEILDSGTTTTHKKPSPSKKYVSNTKKRRREAQQAQDDSSSSDPEGGPSSSSKRTVDLGAKTLLSEEGKVTTEKPKPKPRPRPRPRAKTVGDTRKKAGEDDTTGNSVQQAPLVTAISISEDGLTDVSELTPLSSPVEDDPASGSVEIVEVAPPTSPSKPKIHDHPMFKSAPVKPKPKPVQKKAKDSTKEVKLPWETQPLKNKVEAEEWSLKTIGQFVWVRLDGKNARTAEVHDPRSRSVDTLWWPASVTNKPAGKSLEVKLFHAGSRTLVIEKASRDNVLSRLDPHGRVRFSNYKTASQQRPADLKATSSQNSPRKRARLDDEPKNAWDMAVAFMHSKAVESDSDDEEDKITAPILTAPSSNALRRSDSMPNLKHASSNGNGKTRKGKRKRQQSEPEDDPNLDVTEDEDEDGMVTEEVVVDVDTCVLAREENSRRNSEYWPAKIVEYIPPKHIRGQGKYRVLYLDNTEGIIPRSFFYLEEEDEFYECEVGAFESTVIDNTNDEEDEDQGEEDSNLRSPSPPCQQPPPDRDAFNELSISEQFSYVKPVLQAMIRGEYAPTKTIVNVFMTGTKKQQAGLALSASERGMLDPKEVHALLRCLKWWCLREEGEISGGAQDTGDSELDSVLGEPPASVATEPVPSVAPSSPASTVTPFARSSPGPGVPASSSVSSWSELDPSQSTVAANDEDLNGTDAMDTSADGESRLPIVASSRQIGSPQYESLTPLQRLDFCMNVLLSQAIQQILLWRKGLRTSVELLSDVEEEKLHEKGQQLLQERDWVHDILRLLRRRKGDNFQKPIRRAAQPTAEQVVSRRGRAIKKVDYGE